MKSNYKRLGDYIKEVKVKNNIGITNLLGVNIDKFFMPSVANIVGTELSAYKIVKPNQFACNRMHVGRDYRLPVAISNNPDEFIVSPAYDVFEVIDPKELIPEYLMMWFTRPEFDRNAWFYTDADVRGGLPWKSFCNMRVSIPSPDKQREIIREYHTITDRIRLNERLCQKLEETAQAVYKQWFVDFEFPDENGKPYKSSGGEMEYSKELGMEVPKGWTEEELALLTEMKYGKMLDSDSFLASGYPVFSGYGVRGYYSEFMYVKPQILVLCRGVSGTGEVKMSPPNAFITNLSIVVEIKKGSINQLYLFRYLKNKNLRSLDSGSAQSQITINDLNTVKILKPSKNIQLQFGQMMEKLENSKNHMKSLTERLIELKDTVLAKLATMKN